MGRRVNYIELMMSGGLMMAGVDKIATQTGHGKGPTNLSGTMQSGSRGQENQNMTIQHSPRG